METLTAISRWLAKQHVVTWCVQQEGELWCANAFYLFDAQKVAFYILTEEKTRHAQMSGPQADRKSTRLTPVTNSYLVCRLLLEKKKKMSQIIFICMNHVLLF